MASQGRIPVISLMLAVPDAPAAVEWYKQALGATELWSLGSVAGLEIEGAPFFLAQPAKNAWDSPKEIGTTTVRVELFCDDPDAMVARALEAGATGSLNNIKDHQRPWGSIARVGSPIHSVTSGWSATDLLLNPFPRWVRAYRDNGLTSFILGGNVGGTFVRFRRWSSLTVRPNSACTRQ
jgi:PhnB protein